MDRTDYDGGAYGGGFGSDDNEDKKPRPLPTDLPKSLNDRRRPTELVPETEMYDGWQGTLPHTCRAEHIQAPF